MVICFFGELRLESVCADSDLSVGAPLAIKQIPLWYLADTSSSSSWI